MKRTIAVSTIFILFILSGGVWLSLTHFLPDGVPRVVVVVLAGLLFVALFAWLLVTRVRTILGGTPHLLRDLAAVGLDVSLLVTAFAWAYRTLGIMDGTQSGAPVSHSFADSLYYSIVTFTTLGYGDFYPVGAGRALAAMEAVTGYIILGVLASTAASILTPHAKAGLKEEEGESDD